MDKITAPRKSIADSILGASPTLPASRSPRIESIPSTVSSTRSMASCIIGEGISDAKIALLTPRYSKFQVDGRPLTPDEISDRIKSIAKADPTPTGKYVNWIVNQDVTGKLRFPEDAEKVNATLKSFDRIKNTGDFKADHNPDINSYKTYGDLSTTVKAAQGIENKYSDVADVSKETGGKGVKLVYDKAPYRVYEITDPKAAARISIGTDWCTTDEEKAAEYIKHGPLYVITTF